MGQIEVQGFNDAVHNLALICRLDPEARVLVPVATRSLARDVRWKLHEALGYAVHLQDGGWPVQDVRCLVTTYPARTPPTRSAGTFCCCPTRCGRWGKPPPGQ